MVTTKKSPQTARKSAKDSAKPGATLQSEDVTAVGGRAANPLAASMPFNANKGLEYGHANALTPSAGASEEPTSAALLASTGSEKNSSEKTGGAAVFGVNATIAPMDRVRVDAGGQVLTTNQGVAVSDNQHSLKAGLRGPALLEDFVLREKITHFDHERIPERIVHARGSGAHGYFEAYEPIPHLTCATPFAEAGKITPVFVRFSTVAGERGSADTARDVREIGRASGRERV